MVLMLSVRWLFQKIAYDVLLVVYAIVFGYVSKSYTVPFK